MFQEEHYEEEEGEEGGILGSSFSGGRTVEVFDLPKTEAMFMPSNVDSKQMGFKFKEVFLMLELSQVYSLVAV